MRGLGVLGVPGRRLVGDLPGLGVLGGRSLGLLTQLGLLAGSGLGALARQRRDLGLLERLCPDRLQLLGQRGQPGLGLTAFAVRLSGARRVLASLLVGLRAGRQCGCGRLVLGLGLPLGLDAGGVRLDRQLGLLPRDLLGGVPRPGLGLRELLGLLTLQRSGLGGLRLLQRGLLGELALAGAGQGGFLGGTTALGELGGRALRDGPGLVGLLRRGGVPGGQLLGPLLGLGGALRGLLRGQPLGGLQGGRLLGDPPQVGRTFRGPGVLEQPRLHRLDVGKLGAHVVVGVWSLGILVGRGGRRGRGVVGRTSHCRECSCGAAVKRLAGGGDPRLRQASVDQCLDALPEDLLGEHRRAGDPHTREHVVRADLAPGRALRADRDLPVGEHRSQQVGERRRERERELLGLARYAEPRRLAGQPQGHLGARGQRGRRHGEPLVAALGRLGAAGHLDDKRSSHAHTLGWSACRSSCPTTSTPTARRWRGCSAPWQGNGHGDYPTIDPYQFGQELIFAHDGRPFFHYLSRAWIVDEDGEKVRDAALETGFLRCRPEGKLELLLAHNTGFVETWYGEAEPAKFELVTDAVVRTESAKEYVAGKRLYGLVEGDLLYAYDMAAMGQALQPHTWARLQRQ